MKYQKCEYCKDEIEVHHVKLHSSSCPLRPDNLKLICNYLKGGIIDTRLLKRASFYQWAKENDILTSITITNRFKLERWHQAMYQLLLYGYLSGFIEFIYVEILLSTITFGTMWLDDEQYRAAYDSARNNELTNKGLDSESLYYNYFLLLVCIIHRCNKDMVLKDGSYDENKDVVDVKDATTFMLDFCPDVVKSRLARNLLGQDSITCLKSYTTVQ